MTDVLTDSSQFANRLTGVSKVRAPIIAHQATTATAACRLPNVTVTAPAWSNEQLQYLKENGTKLSASELAAGLGGGATRGSVIGAMRRHRIPLTKTRQKPAAAPAKPAKPPPPPRVVLPAADARKVLEDALRGAARPLPLASLRSVDCHWPIGDPSQDGFGFCGATTKPGKPYCSGHCRLAYRPTDDRRAK